MPQLFPLPLMMIFLIIFIVLIIMVTSMFFSSFHSPLSSKNFKINTKNDFTLNQSLSLW